MNVLRRRLISVAPNVRYSSGHSQKTENFWKNVFLFVGLPCVGLGTAYCFVISPEEHKRPEFVKYEYLRIINKRFPWGDGQRGLFFNPHVNALPDGYIDENEH